MHCGKVPISNYIIEFDAEVSFKFCPVLNFLIDKNFVSNAILYANGCKMAIDNRCILTLISDPNRPITAYIPAV